MHEILQGVEFNATAVLSVELKLTRDTAMVLIYMCLYYHYSHIAFSTCILQWFNNKCRRGSRARG